MENQLIFTKTTPVTAVMADRWGRLRPSALLEVIQQTATDHANALGMGRDLLGPRGLFWAIVRQSMEICRLPCMGETLLTETWPAPPSRTAFPRHMIGKTPEGEILFRSVALWVFMDVNKHSMVLPSASDVSVPGIRREYELPLPTGIASRACQHQEVRRVRYSELDCNGHLTNTRYLNWMEDLLPAAYHRDHSLRKLHICYLSEALEDQEVRLDWSLEGSLLSLEGHRDQAGTAHRVFALRAEYQ